MHPVSIRGKRRRKGEKKWRVKELNWREGKGVELEGGIAKELSWREGGQEERERSEGKR